MKPTFVDNQNGNSLAKAIAQHVRDLKVAGEFPFRFDIASGFFNVAGFREIREAIEQVGEVRLLLGAEPIAEATRSLAEPPRPGIDTNAMRGAELASAIEKLDAGIRHDRDLLPFDEDTDRSIRRLLELFHHGQIRVRRYRREFLHAKAYLFQTRGGGVVVGSSNFTYGGLSGNLELNLGHYDEAIVGRVSAWFDDLWESAEPYDLAALFDRLFAEFPPFLIYLRVLFELYGAELGEEAAATGDVPVTNFQQHGVWRALRIIENCGGALVADGVGLGKTFIAGEVIRRYRERKQRVLLVCPATLRDGTWKRFLARYQLFVEMVSYEELANDLKPGAEKTHLQSPVEEFSLVVIDESHNYRNPDAPMRAGVLRQLLLGRRPHVLMLTATPVNNSLWDLYHLLRYFVKQDALLADRGVLSIRDRFEHAARVDPFSLSPDLLYPVIDATTVKRTRPFIKKHYSNDLIEDASGKRVPIRFPKPTPSSIEYSLDGVLPGFLDELEEALMPPGGTPKLTLARYQPENYPAGRTKLGTDTAIVGLLRSGLLKRFESSVASFAATTRRLVREHDMFLEQLERGWVVGKELLKEIAYADDEEAMQQILDDSDEKRPAAEFNVAELRRDVRADRDLLDDFCKKAEKVRANHDPKLAALVEELERIAKEAKDESVGEADERNKRKVLVFSAYVDTINWIESFLDGVIDRDPRLAKYRGRVASVEGDKSRAGVTREMAVQGFAPDSAGAPQSKVGEDRDRFDLLLSTDVLAEGMNLQQCRNIINYDLPWNPMRLVQRHGRIDRIGSPHDRVFLRTFFPDAELDRLLALENRVRRKLAQAAHSVGVEVTPIEGGAVGMQSFSETRDEIEKLQKGDATLYESGGTAGAAQSGEEYRQVLRKALATNRREIEELPWKAGSGLAKGDRRGHFFCGKAGSRIYTRFVPFEHAKDPAGAPIVTELGTCLRLIECAPDAPLTMPLYLKQTAFGAWEKARASILDAWTKETDPANLQPRVPPLNRKIAELIRDFPAKDIPEVRWKKALDAVEAPCSGREQRALRAVFERDDFPSRDAKSTALIEEIERLGLEPFRSPDPLPPIQLADIHLICWMAIERE